MTILLALNESGKCQAVERDTTRERERDIARSKLRGAFPFTANGKPATTFPSQTTRAAQVANQRECRARRVSEKARARRVREQDRREE